MQRGSDYSLIHIFLVLIYYICLSIPHKKWLITLIHLLEMYFFDNFVKTEYTSDCIKMNKTNYPQIKSLLYVILLAVVAFLSGTFFWSLSWLILTLLVIGLATIIYFSLRNTKHLQKISLFLITIILLGYSFFCILLANSNM